MSCAIPVDYFIKPCVCIEWSRPCDNTARRLSLMAAALDMCKITAGCSDIEKKLIMNAVKRKKNSIRKGRETDERK